MKIIRANMKFLILFPLVLIGIYPFITQVWVLEMVKFSVYSQKFTVATQTNIVAPSCDYSGIRVEATSDNQNIHLFVNCSGFLQ